ncbi:MAG: hypothetical protein R3F43_27505 [bacterium]
MVDAFALLLAVIGSPVPGCTGGTWAARSWVISAIFCLTGIPWQPRCCTLILWQAGPGAFNERYNAALLALEADRAARLTQQLEALHALHLKGALTPEGFEREKALLLDHQPDALATLLQGFQHGGFDTQVCSGRSAEASACRKPDRAPGAGQGWRAGIAAGWKVDQGLE